MSYKRFVLGGGLFAVVSFSTSCTLAKPVVCAVTTPIIVLAQPNCFCGTSRDLGCALVAVSVVGAAGGLVTGIISDINVLTGKATDATRNLHDPFATNTSEPSY